VSKLKLRNNQDATDNTTADGSVSVSGDPTTAKVDFPLAQLGVLEKPDYKAYAVSKDRVEADTKQTLRFVSTPYLTGINPQATDLGSTTLPLTIQLMCYHLDKLSKTHTSSTAPAISEDLPIDKSTATNVSFQIKSGDAIVSPGDHTKSPLELSISLAANDPTGSAQTLTITGKPTSP
jgi:hypothetical protein